MLYQILPRYDYQFSVDHMRMFFKTLSTAAKKLPFSERIKSVFNTKDILDYSFIIDCQKNSKGDDKISFFFRVNHEDQAEMAINSLKILFQDHGDVFEVEELDHYSTIHTLRIKEAQQEKDEEGNVRKKSLATWSDDKVFMYVLGTLQANTRIQVDFTIHKSKEATKSVFRGVSSDVQADCLIRTLAKTKYERNILVGITNNIINLTAGEVSLFADYRDTYRFTTLSGNELINIIQFPTFYRREETDILKRINKLQIGQRTLKQGEFASGIKCGKVSHPMQDRPVQLSEKQLRKHMFVTGQTGSGKSSAVEEMMRDILKRKIEKGIKNAPGFSFFDPAETSALGVIDMILKLESDGYDISELIEHVHYIDFDYSDCIFPISLLNKGMPATEIIDFFKQLYGDMQTVQVDRNMTSAINTLLMDQNDHNVSDIPRLFQDEEFRMELARNLAQDPYAEDSVKFLKGKFNQAAIDPILNRTDPFLNTRQKKLMFSLPENKDGLKNLKKWFDDGDIILYNLKGLNDFDRKTIIGYTCTKYYTVGLSREDGALLHLTYIDESHKVQLPILPKILAELRKNGVALCPMTQYLDQYDETYLQALLGNVGTKISFRQGNDAARRLANNLPGNVSKEALKQLPDLLGYVSSEDDADMKSVLIKVDPPYRYTDGKLLPYPDHSENQKVTKYNQYKNRKFAQELMQRDFIHKDLAERLVFHKIYKQEAELQLENELLQEGDALWDQ